MIIFDFSSVSVINILLARDPNFFMKNLSVVLSLFINLAFPVCTTAQNATILTDSIPVQKRPVVKRTVNSLHSYLVPSAMVLYGALSLHVTPLQNINEAFQNGLAAPNGRHTNLDDYLQYTPALASHVISLAGVKGKHTFFERVIISGMAAAMSTGVVFTVKRITNETRPDGSDNLSFPSGHTATAFGSAELIRQEYGDASPWYGVGAYAVASLTGYLRMYNNKHWLGDVLAGAGVGIISAKIATRLYPLVKRIVFKNKTPFTAVYPSYQQGAFTVNLVHVIQ